VAANFGAPVPYELLEVARGAIRAMKENRAMTDQDRLNAIVRDITTRQVTMYVGRRSPPGELMANEIVRLRASVEAMTGALMDARAEISSQLNASITIIGKSCRAEYLKMLLAEIDAALEKEPQEIKTQ
jgi:hypothetical protein